MNRTFLARTGAACFVGIAIAMTLVQMREEPRQPPATTERNAWIPDGDPLPARLSACSEMGELALASPDCRAAWAEKRRRFFEVAHPDAYRDLAADAPMPPNEER